MMKNDEGEYYRPKDDILWFKQKNYDVERKSRGFFIITLRLVRPSIAESFRLAVDTFV